MRIRASLLATISLGLIAAVPALAAVQNINCAECAQAAALAAAQSPGNTLLGFNPSDYISGLSTLNPLGNPLSTAQQANFAAAQINTANGAKTWDGGTTLPNAFASTWSYAPSSFDPTFRFNWSAFTNTFSSNPYFTMFGNGFYGSAFTQGVAPFSDAASLGIVPVTSTPAVRASSAALQVSLGGTPLSLSPA
jgi:hypothetical protein